ncbi:hypothetical protein G6M89_20040 [Natronolimnobius sp. AArcel1]|uniref:carboxypeptidase regulatory-like domain-containing protein n=1 Tax=Natronolimnobius sp. AArcel1 TaxID=1679093 RepID=UPI0013ECB619|nr:carboxypeptidase regulatory-like domain-containing protein [Natronolimnobius sp. AArcel1]NGM71265.1 hypothetical protein [Natronolimnobius sp. AArcel1]
MRVDRHVTFSLIAVAILVVGALAVSPAVLGLVAADDVSLTAEDDEAGAATSHTWTFDDVDYEGEVETITVDYPVGTSFNGLDNDDVSVAITRDGESEPTDISVNADTYSGSQATFDLSGIYNTDIDGPVTVAVDGLENPSAGDHEATLTFEGDDTVTANAVFTVTESENTEPTEPAEADLTLDPELEGAASTHTWAFDDVDYDGDVDSITVEYPDSTSFDGLDDDDVSVAITRDGEREPTEIDVNSDTYGGSQATFDLSRIYNTDIDGAVSIAITGIENPLAGDHEATLTFEGDDTVTTETAFTVAADGEDGDDTDETLVAEIVDTDGDAVENTDFVVELEGPSEDVTVVTTDNDGLAEIDVSEAGTYDVTITTQEAGTVTDTVAVSGTTEALFALESPETGAIGALITDADGDPLPEGTWVTLSGGDDFGADRTGLLEADRTVLLEGIEPGTYDLSATTSASGETNTTTVTVSANETTPTELTYGDVPTSATLEGTVSTPDGNALADETVVVEYDGPESGVSIVETDADGNFAVHRVAAGTYEVTVTAAAYDSSDSVLVDAESGETAEIVLNDLESGSIVGTVTDADGEPLPDGTWVSFSADGFETDKTVQIDDNGEFLLEGIEPGSYEVVAETLAFGETDAVTVDVTADETAGAAFTYAQDGADVPEDRGEDVTELRFQSDTVTEDVVVHGDVDGNVVLAGNTQIDGKILIAGDVDGDVVVRGASSVDRILVAGDVDGDVRLLGSGTVAGDVTVGSAEIVAVRGNAALEGTLTADDIGTVEVVGSGSVGEVTVDGPATNMELTGGSTVGSVAVAGDIDSFEAVAARPSTGQ